MKKVIALLVAAGAGYLAYRSWNESKAENELWARATDPVEPRDLR